MPGRRGINPITLFLQKVDVKGFDPNQCWPYLGAGKGNGYGNVNLQGRTIGAHVRAYELLIGPVPPGLEVCHSCDFRPCCNPDHLFPGTRKENMEDCVSKRRTAGGNRKHLKEDTLQEIARRLVIGIPAKRIARDLDVDYGTITAIRRGDRYGWIAKQLPIHRAPGG